MIRTLLQRQAYFTGFHPGVLRRSMQNLPAYLRDLNAYRKANSVPSLHPHSADFFPILTDMTDSAGNVRGHYFHQDLWAARRIFARRPAQHLDIGSRIDGFVAHLLAFMPVTIVDIRPMTSDIAGLTFLQDDASELRNLPTGSVDSLSTLHAAEHFGLGRYTDPIDPQACFRFMAALQRVLAPGGRLYFSVPVGRERVEFNAHRIFAPQTILNAFSQLELVSFAYVGDDDNLHEDCTPGSMPSSEYACGLFEFTRRSQ